MSLQIAVLLACHNRKDKTIECLTKLYDQNYLFDVYLVDDGSTDGTSQAVGSEFPKVEIIKGSGDLFWNKGMRLAWQSALSKKAYNFIIWLNDDTILDSNAFQHLFSCYNDLELSGKGPAIITGACRMSYNKNEFSYGGRNVKGSPVIPNSIIQECRYINGNIVLIPKAIYENIGILSEDFTHAHGDFDYGIRSIKAGYNCYTTKEYIATCPINEALSAWSKPEVSLKKRLSLINSPLGFDLKEYSRYLKKDKGLLSSKIIYIKVYFRALFPQFYLNIKK